MFSFSDNVFLIKWPYRKCHDNRHRANRTENRNSAFQDSIKYCVDAYLSWSYEQSKGSSEPDDKAEYDGSLNVRVVDLACKNL